MYDDGPKEQMMGIGASQLSRPMRRSLTERLGDERTGLTARIAEIDQVLEALAKHPEVESLINLVSKYT